MFNPALKKFYTSGQSGSAKSTSISLDISDVKAVAQILRDKKNEATAASSLTLTKPVLFNIKKDTSIAIVLGDTEDLKKLSCVQTALSQTNNVAGVFAESEALYHKIDPNSLKERSVNIDAIDLSKISSEDAAAIFDGIVALSENNSFRKTQLPQQFQDFLTMNTQIKNELENNGPKYKK